MPQPDLDGLDIHDVYQPVTNWEAATNYRLMSCKLSEGRSVRPGGIRYFNKFREHNVEFRGVYHWIRGDSSMRTQADTMLRGIAQLGGLQAGEFVQADWETTPSVATPTSDQCWDWCQYIENEYPGRVIVYSSDWMPDSTLDSDSRREFDEWFRDHPEYPLWFANYNTSTKETGGWAECEKYGADIWQWTSSVVVPGISSRCDGNMVMQWDTLQRISGRFVDVGKPEPQPKPPRPQPGTPGFIGTPGGTDMSVGILIEYGEGKNGQPTASWYHALLWGSSGIEHLSSGTSVEALKSVNAPRISVDAVNPGVGDNFVKELIEDNGTYGPSPYGPGSSSPNPTLHEVWEANSRG